MMSWYRTVFDTKTPTPTKFGWRPIKNELGALCRSFLVQSDANQIWSTDEERGREITPTCLPFTI